MESCCRRWTHHSPRPAVRPSGQPATCPPRCHIPSMPPPTPPAPLGRHMPPQTPHAPPRTPHAPLDATCPLRRHMPPQMPHAPVEATCSRSGHMPPSSIRPPPPPPQGTLTRYCTNFHSLQTVVHVLTRYSDSGSCRMRNVKPHTHRWAQDDVRKACDLTFAAIDNLGILLRNNKHVVEMLRSYASVWGGHAVLAEESGDVGECGAGVSLRGSVPHRTPAKEVMLATERGFRAVLFCSSSEPVGKHSQHHMPLVPPNPPPPPATARPLPLHSKP
jgi:hypothetical protein